MPLKHCSVDHLIYSSSEIQKPNKKLLHIDSFELRSMKRIVRPCHDTSMISSEYKFEFIEQWVVS